MKLENEWIWVSIPVWAAARVVWHLVSEWLGRVTGGDEVTARRVGLVDLYASWPLKICLANPIRGSLFEHDYLPCFSTHRRLSDLMCTSNWRGET